MLQVFQHRSTPRPTLANRGWGTLRISLLRENVQRWYSPLALPCQHRLRNSTPGHPPVLPCQHPLIDSTPGHPPKSLAQFHFFPVTGVVVLQTFQHRSTPRPTLANRGWGTLRISLLRENVQRWYPPLALLCQKPLTCSTPGHPPSNDSGEFERRIRFSGRQTNSDRN